MMNAGLYGLRNKQGRGGAGKVVQVGGTGGPPTGGCTGTLSALYSRERPAVEGSAGGG